MADSKNIDLEVLLATLRAERDTYLTKAAGIDATIETIIRVHSGSVAIQTHPPTVVVAPAGTSTVFESPPPVGSGGRFSQRANNLPKNSPFYGLNLGEAAAKQLSRSAVPQTAKEIWAVLEASGYKLRSRHPHSKVSQALARREHIFNDVVKVENYKWDLRSRYTEEQLNEFKAKVVDRAAVTKAGMDALKRQGVRFGAKLKFTPEVITKFRHYVEVEGMTIMEASKAVGVSHTSYYQNKKFFPGLKLNKNNVGRRRSDPTRQLNQARSERASLKLVSSS